MGGSEAKEYSEYIAKQFLQPLKSDQELILNNVRLISEFMGIKFNAKQSEKPYQQQQQPHNKNDQQKQQTQPIQQQQQQLQFSSTLSSQQLQQQMQSQKQQQTQQQQQMGVQVNQTPKKNNSVQGEQRRQQYQLLNSFSQMIEENKVVKNINDKLESLEKELSRITYESQNKQNQQNTFPKPNNQQYISFRNKDLKTLLHESENFFEKQYDTIAQVINQNAQKSKGPSTTNFDEEKALFDHHLTQLILIKDFFIQKIDKNDIKEFLKAKLDIEQKIQNSQNQNQQSQVNTSQQQKEQKIQELDQSQKEKKENENLKQEDLIKKLQDQLKELEQKNTNMTEVIKSLNDQLSKKTDELNQKTDELNQKTDELNKKTNELNEKTTEVNEKTDELSQLKEKLKQQEKEFQKTKTQSENKLKDIQKQIEAVQQENQQLIQNNKKLTRDMNDFEKLKITESSLRIQFNKKENDLKILQQKYDKFVENQVNQMDNKDQSQQIKAQIEEKDKEIQALKSENADLTSQINQLNWKVTEMKNKAEEYQQKYEDEMQKQKKAQKVDQIQKPVQKAKEVCVYYFFNNEIEFLKEVIKEFKINLGQEFDLQSEFQDIYNVSLKMQNMGNNKKQAYLKELFSKYGMVIIFDQQKANSIRLYAENIDNIQNLTNQTFGQSLPIQVIDVYDASENIGNYNQSKPKVFMHKKNDNSGGFDIDKSNKESLYKIISDFIKNNCKI